MYVYKLPTRVVWSLWNKDCLSIPQLKPTDIISPTGHSITHACLHAVKWLKRLGQVEFLTIRFSSLTIRLITALHPPGMYSPATSPGCTYQDALTGNSQWYMMIDFWTEADWYPVESWPELTGTLLRVLPGILSDQRHRNDQPIKKYHQFIPLKTRCTCALDSGSHFCLIYAALLKST